ncbi:hypothetical protein PP7435_CHR3-0586 [Komagataella phaffii CBS 7435]|uniref:Uncharacterized protein n=1 Tax=Komagataella phaffii (strain ATCC 76273 / CBS 7435 / CECT 11047 / NRRL Y-11430 / Wegner 21-1) TaxID=981350 RepID=F2QVW6_KOMPC|nr:Hypothetical protein BQ9382_C3-3125 [Komagataella phaffii CBS 7435]CCA39544.1 hypothetical protein PP7435_CHR3-0586 [Komagataella phaffii CBS 7435]
MSEIRVSRAQLCNESEDESLSETEYQAPDLDFDIVDVNQEDEPAKEKENKEVDEEFAFPLFSITSSTTVEERGRSQEMKKVSLREPSEDTVIQKRPDSYYFVQYDDKLKNQFKQVVVTAEEIIQGSKDIVFSKKRLVDLDQFNRDIEEVLSRKKKRHRPGKRKRMNKLECDKRKEERKILEEKERKEKFEERQKRPFQAKSFGSHNQISRMKQKTTFNSKSYEKGSKSKPQFRTE